MACRFGTDQHFPLFFRAEPEAFFQGAIDIRIFEIPFEVSLFGAHLEFKRTDGPVDRALGNNSHTSSFFTGVAAVA